MKRAVIIHCWDGMPDTSWYRSAEQGLTSLGIDVQVPAMPDTHAPVLARWVTTLAQAAGHPNKNLYLIGHSVGCVTIMRFLESLSDDAMIGGVVFVAGFTDSLIDVPAIINKTVLPPFFESPLSWDIIKKRARHFTAIHSDNDPYVDLRHAAIFEKKLGANIIIKHNKGHFSETDGDLKAVCRELPEMVEAIRSML